MWLVFQRAVSHFRRRTTVKSAVYSNLESVAGPSYLRTSGALRYLDCVIRDSFHNDQASRKSYRTPPRYNHVHPYDDDDVPK